MEKEIVIIKKNKFWIGLSGVGILLLFAYSFLSLGVKPKIDTTAIKEIAFIDYPVEFNYRQTKNDCGPFSVAAVVRALAGKNIKSVIRKIM
jgi:hypothetical protein